MAYADPQSVTIAGSAVSLPRVSSDHNAGSFSSNDGLVKLSVSHTNGKRNRRVLRLDHKKVAADPFTTGVNTNYNMACYVVCDVPTVGYTVAQQKEIVDALVVYLTASTGARVTQLLGGEN